MSTVKIVNQMREIARQGGAVVTPEMLREWADALSAQAPADPTAAIAQTGDFDYFASIGWPSHPLTPSPPGATLPVAWRWLREGAPEIHSHGGSLCWEGTGPDPDVEALAARREVPRTVQRLYAHPPTVPAGVSLEGLLVAAWLAGSQSGHERTVEGCWSAGADDLAKEWVAENIAAMDREAK